MSCKRALETFNSKSLKIQNKKHQEKLVNGQDVFLIHPGGSGKYESFLEHQITKSTRRGIGLNFELERQNSRSNKFITCFKDGIQTHEAKQN